MGSRYTTKALSDFAWSLALPVVVLAFVWMVVFHPWFAAAWCVACCSVAPLAVAFVRFNKREG